MFLDSFESGTERQQDKSSGYHPEGVWCEDRDRQDGRQNTEYTDDYGNPPGKSFRFTEFHKIFSISKNNLYKYHLYFLYQLYPISSDVSTNWLLLVY